MPQARLPDINTQFIKFTNEAVNSWKSENDESCLGSLYALNGLLPDKYRVNISDEAFKEATEEKMFYLCSNPECKCETPYEQIKTYEVLLDVIDQTLVNQTFKTCWKCPKCLKEHDLIKTNIAQDEKKDPDFYKVVPEPPRKHDGLLDRQSYRRKFTVWFWTCLGEIMNQMGRFRDDNWTKETTYDTMSDYEGNLENADT